ncbi:hypothetical protein [Stratiformator vulcanicus]|nr:hypothetical protein [Stratiformator vulcanicus]
MLPLSDGFTQFREAVDERRTEFALSYDRFLKLDQTLTEQGYRVVSIDGYAVRNRDYYAATWDRIDEPEWKACYRTKPDDFKKLASDYASEGYRLVDLCSYAVNRQDYYAAIWEKTLGPEQELEIRLPAADFQKAFDARIEMGCRPSMLSSIAINGEDYYAVVWEGRTEPECRIRYRLSDRQYQQELADYREQGFRLVDVNSHVANRTEIFSAIWEKDLDTEWKTEHRLPLRRLKTKHDAMIKDGYHLVDLAVRESGPGVFYDAVWSR